MSKRDERQGCRTGDGMAVLLSGSVVLHWERHGIGHEKRQKNNNKDTGDCYNSYSNIYHYGNFMCG